MIINGSEPNGSMTVNPLFKALIHPKADENKRLGFVNRISEYEKQGKEIIYFDESGFARSMCILRIYGYAQRGKRCYEKHGWHAVGRVIPSHPKCCSHPTSIYGTFSMLIYFDPAIELENFHIGNDHNFCEYIVFR